MTNGNYDPIEQELVNALKKFPTVTKKESYTNADWTKGVKAIFGAIGDQRGYKTYFSNGVGRPFNQIQQDIRQMLGGVQVPNVLSGWLYDILWWEQDKNGYVIDIPLVAESDWGSIEAVKDDFQKLLLARSKYRVMIFECGRNVIEWCIEQIKNFKYTQTGDRYLFCSWEPRHNDSFYFELYVVPDLDLEKRVCKARTREQEQHYIYLEERRKYYGSLTTEKLREIWNEVWNNCKEMEEDEKELLRTIVKKSENINPVPTYTHTYSRGKCNACGKPIDFCICGN